MTDPDTRARQSQALRDAAQAKREAATLRAEKGIRALVKSGDPIDFRSVARTAGVSINFLYTNEAIRGRVESLRAQQREATRPAPDPPESDSTAIIRVLTAKLKDERRRHREEVTTLRAECAALHGQLLDHRRGFGNHNVEVEVPEPATNTSKGPPPHA